MRGLRSTVLVTTLASLLLASSRAPAAAPSPLALVRYLRKSIGLTETDLADATGASTRTVRRWTNASDDLHRDPNYSQQIDDLNTVVEELRDSLTTRGIRQWLRARNRYLKGQRPIDLLREGRFDDVHEAAIAFRDGVYV